MVKKKAQTKSKPVKIPASPLKTRRGPKGRVNVLLDTPAFKNEKEEAEWWDANQQLVEDLIIKYGRRIATKSITVRLPVSDLERARALADARGVPYQTLLKVLLHDGLKREEAHQSK